MSISPAQESYSQTHRDMLLAIARRALHAAVIRKTFLAEALADGTFPRSGGAFVTLHRRGRLRGCVGQFAMDLPLAQIVAYCATAAACDDPRFRAVEPREFDEIEIEISVVSDAIKLQPDRIEIGRHGLIVTNGVRRGVLLPHVAVRYKWTTTRFLQETCAKAGLDRNAWALPNTRIEAFTAEVFSESEKRLAENVLLKEPQPNEDAATKRSYSSST